MSTVFDKPEWDLRATPKDRCNGDDLSTIKVQVYPESGDELTLCLITPTGLFTFLRDRYRITEERGNDYKSFSFYAEQEGSRWYLGLSYNNNATLDLWYYVPSNVPYWLREVEQCAIKS